MQLFFSLFAAHLLLTLVFGDHYPLDDFSFGDKICESHCLPNVVTEDFLFSHLLLFSLFFDPQICSLFLKGGGEAGVNFVKVIAICSSLESTS